MRRLARLQADFRPAWLVTAILVLALAAGCSFISGGDSGIVYVSDTDGDPEIYRVDPETGESIRLTNNGAADEEPRWSPDGRQIAYVSHEFNDREINVVDKDGEERSRLTNNPGPDASPRWSPADSKLAFLSQSEEDGTKLPRVYSVALESREIKRVTFDGAIAELGNWSPDGQWIVFARQEPEADRGLWLRNPEGVNLLRLTEGADSQPRWSPNGKYIVFVREEGDARAIHIIERNEDDSWGERADTTRLTQGSYDDYSPVWNSNNKTLAFVSNRDGNPEIYTMQADGADQLRLTINTADDLSPDWSPDGKRLVFVTYLYGSADILVMNADGTEQRRLTEDDSQETAPDW